HVIFHLMPPIILKIISLPKGFQETVGNYKYSVLLHNNHKSLEQSNLDTFFLCDKCSRFFKIFEIGFPLPSTIRKASFSSTRTSSKVTNVPKGYLSLYVGEQMKRSVIPMSYLNHGQPHNSLHKKMFSCI
ncbi:hypothetical protein KIW84_030092, partial [Lathyrus oleraceus]